jgi:myo-inositol 2-dehydrogenase / D-chiro-inositol 1-dehydrogenase
MSEERKKFKVGFASFAHMHSHSYLNALKSFSDVEIIGVAEENTESLEAVKQMPYQFYDSYEDLCNAPDIDCIVITSENCFHSKIAIKALENDKHVIVEKPIATTLEDAQIMIEAAKKSKGKLVQCYPCRYHPTSQAIKKLIDEDSLGKIVAISATNHGRMPPHKGVDKWFSTKELAGGGALMDHITHVADLIFWFTNAKIETVFATAANLFHPDLDIDDAGMVLLKYDNGMKVSLDPSWSRPANFATWGDVTMMIIGTKQTVTMDMFAQFIDIQRNQDTHANWLNYDSDMDKTMMRDFVDHLKRNEQPMLSGEDGRKALEVVIKAYESANSNKLIKFS